VSHTHFFIKVHQSATTWPLDVWARQDLKMKRA
jgi:hypothetical protein